MGWLRGSGPLAEDVVLSTVVTAKIATNVKARFIEQIS